MQRVVGENVVLLHGAAGVGVLEKALQCGRGGHSGILYALRVRADALSKKIVGGLRFRQLAK